MRAHLLAAMLLLPALIAANTVVYDVTSVAPVRLDVGDTFVVKLNALPGAGYVWAPGKDGRPGLSFDSVKTLPSTKANIGGQQTQVLRFTATALGEQFLTVDYGRPWEVKSGGKPEKSISVKVFVQQR